MTTKKAPRKAAWNKPRPLSKRMHKLIELQVREYNERYHPELRDARVEIVGNIVRVFHRKSRGKSR